MSPSEKVDCRNCLHFRKAPYEARVDGCYHPKHMRAKQSARYLDEQQLAGNHEKINLRGDCAQYEARPSRPSLWVRLMRA